MEAGLATPAAAKAKNINLRCAPCPFARKLPALLAVGCARGTYPRLHEVSGATRIVHLNVKNRNIFFSPLPPHLICKKWPTSYPESGGVAPPWRRGAMLHVAGDLVQSMGVALAGALIWWKQACPACIRLHPAYCATHVIASSSFRVLQTTSCSVAHCDVCCMRWHSGRCACMKRPSRGAW